MNLIDILYYSRVTNLVRFNMQEEEGLMYQPGDHLYIYPENNTEHVEELLRRIHCEVNTQELIMVEQNGCKILIF